MQFRVQFFFEINSINILIFYIFEHGAEFGAEFHLEL